MNAFNANYNMAPQARSRAEPGSGGLYHDSKYTLSCTMLMALLGSFM